MLAGTNLFFLASTFIPNPIYPSSPLLPKAALALAAINANQLWVSGINFVKFSPEGFNTLKIFKVTKQRIIALQFTVPVLYTDMRATQCVYAVQSSSRAAVSSIGMVLLGTI